MLIFVDCEAFGGCPATGRLTEFGAVVFPTREVYRGALLVARPSDGNPAIPEALRDAEQGWSPGWTFDDQKKMVFVDFARWLADQRKANRRGGRPIFVSDNPAYDFQWINDGFLTSGLPNPFGHSARRISDFYAGLVGDFYQTQAWKALRVTPHTHDPVDDAMGNLEAFERLLKGER